MNHGASIAAARRWLAVVGVYTVLAVTLFWRLWVPGSTGVSIGGAGSDFMRQFHPYRAFVARAWAELRPPLWNPHQYAGTAAWEDPQMAVVYPFRLLQAAVALGSDPLPVWAVEVEALVHIVWAALGAAWLVRGLGAGWPGSFLSGAVYGFGGYLTGYPLEQLAVADTAAWLPWLMGGLVRAVPIRAVPIAAPGEARPRRLRWGLLTGIAGALLVLAGHPQTGLYAAWLAAGWIAWATAVSGDLRGLGRGLMAGGIAAGLSAVAWLPTAALVPWIDRRLSVEEQLVGIPFAEIGQLFLPHLGGRWWPLWLGAVPLLLAPLALVPRKLEADGPESGARASGPRAAGPRANAFWTVAFWSAAFRTTAFRTTAFRTTAFWTAAFWALAAGLALVLAMGSHGPLLAPAVDLVPGFDWFRHHERIAGVFSLSVAVLAGLALTRAQHRPNVARLGARVFGGAAVLAVTALALTLGAGAGAEAGSDSAQLPWDVVRDDLTWVVLAAGAAALGLAQIRRSRGVALLLVAAILPLVSVNRGNVLVPLEWDTAAETLPPADGLLRALEPAMPGRVSSEARIRPGPNAAMLHGFYDVTGDSPYHLATAGDLGAALPEIDVWRLLNVDRVVTDRTFEAEAPLEPVFVSDEMRTLTPTDTEPPVPLSPQGDTAGTDPAAPRLYRVAVDAPPVWGVDLEVLVPSEGDAELTRLARLPRIPGELAGFGRFRILGSLELEAPGAAVFAMSFAPGWRGTARARDGSEIRLDPVRAYATSDQGGLLAAELPAGSWRISWTYLPNAIILGAVLTVLTVLLGIGLWIRPPKAL